MTIFRAELKTTLLLNSYTSVIVTPNTHTQQQYLLETFSIRQLQIPKCHRPSFMAFLNIILYQLCINDYIQGLQAFLLSVFVSAIH